jgi:hypothetical protein
MLARARTSPGQPQKVSESGLGPEGQVGKPGKSRDRNVQESRRAAYTCPHAHAGVRPRVPSMGGWFDAAALHAQEYTRKHLHNNI